MPLKIVIVGGVAGGASVAARLRRLDETAEIVLFERDEYISFANCGLPYYIGEVIEKRKRLLLQTPESMKERFNIDVRVNSEVTRILRNEKRVEVLNRLTGETYYEPYDTMVLSPGAAPFTPSIPGVDGPNVFTIRNIPDTDTIKAFVDERGPREAVVVGAGFIGLEMAENLHLRGVGVTVVELAEHIMPGIDFEMAAPLQQHLASKGVRVMCGSGLTALRHEGGRTLVELDDGQTLDADMVVLGIGVRPEVKLAKEAGLELGVTGGIAVDEYLKTSDPHIYALGDAIQVKNSLGAPTLIPLAGPANRQGRIVANNIAGRNERYAMTLGTAILKVFDMAIGMTGASEKSLIRHDIPYKAAICHPASHATYYPGAGYLSIKVLFAPDDGKLLGAQVVGDAAVDKTIDAFAIALKAGMTVVDLTELELAYAPPFSSAKSPVNMAGYVASNILKGDMQTVSWEDADRRDPETTVLLDVRSRFELKISGKIDDAMHIPIDDLRGRLGELPKDKEIYVYCEVGIRSYIGYRILAQNGFRVKNIAGGFTTYKVAHDARCGLGKVKA